MLNSISESQYKLVPLLTMLFLAFALADPILANKSILTPMGALSAMVFVSPIWFMLGNVIAEVYGYRLAIKVFWTTMVCNFIAGIMCHFFIKLHSPSIWHDQPAFEFVFNHFLDLIIFEIAAAVIAYRINIYLLTKWKILLEGKYFWLRSTGATAIGQIIFTLALTPVWIWYGSASSFFDIVIMILGICGIRILLTAFLAFPASAMVLLLKVIEKIDIYETAKKFKPLKLI